MSNLGVRYEIVGSKTCGTSLFDLEQGWQENILGPLPLGSEFYSGDSTAECEPTNIKTTADGEAVKLSETIKSSTSGLSCQKCDIDAFNNLGEQRGHYRSDYHRMNVQRRLKRLAPLTPIEFEKLLESKVL
ncbi:hypothetical protein L0F63_003741 [Massospora cicadina]|nr:hypothetical protein L0F63_003741 [Massospora cicadina]